MPVFYGAIDLAKNELRNAVIQNLGAAPASPVKGQIYFDSTTNTLYYWDGTTWQAMKSGTGGPPTGAAGGDLSGSYPNPGVRAINGTVLSTLATGLLKNTTGTGVPSVAAAADVPTAAIGAAGPMSATTVLSAILPPTADLNVNSHKIVNVAYPINDTDGANKNYVDNSVQGLDAKQSVHAATTPAIGNINLAAAPNNLDGVTLLANDRVLVKDQTAAAQNGIYVVTTLGTGNNGVWTRALDMDTWSEVPSAYVFVEAGNTNADNGWECISDPGGGTIGTTPINWVQFSGAGQITAGAGLTKTGNQLDVVAGDTSLTVAADSIVVNTSVIASQAWVTGQYYAHKYSAMLTGTSSPETVIHGLNTRDIMLTVLNSVSPYTAVEVDWDATTLTTATIRYNPNLGSGYHVVVLG